MSAAAGKRLRAFVELRIDMEPGWTEDLARSLGITKSGLQAWFSGTNEPDAASLRRLADRLGVKRWEIVKAMDGE